MLPQSETVFLWTHIHFDLQYNGDNVVVATVSEKTKEVEIPFGDDANDDFEVTFTYSVKWTENKDVTLKTR